MVRFPLPNKCLCMQRCRWRVYSLCTRRMVPVWVFALAEASSVRTNGRSGIKREHIEITAACARFTFLSELFLIYILRVVGHRCESTWSNHWILLFFIQSKHFLEANIFENGGVKSGNPVPFSAHSHKQNAPPSPDQWKRNSDERAKGILRYDLDHAERCAPCISSIQCLHHIRLLALLVYGMLTGSTTRKPLFIFISLSIRSTL